MNSKRRTERSGAAAGRRAGAPVAAPPIPEVAALLATLAPARREAVEALRRLLLAAAPGVREEWKWNAPSYRTTETFATLRLRARSGPPPLGVVLHAGAKAEGRKFADAVADPEGLLKVLAPDRALLDFVDAADVRAKSAAVARVLKAWARAAVPGAARP